MDCEGRMSLRHSIYALSPQKGCVEVFQCCFSPKCFSSHKINPSKFYHQNQPLIHLSAASTVTLPKKVLLLYTIKELKKMDLKDKVALVTGAATGLGRTFCEEILRRGGKVSICDLDSDAGEHTADELGQTFGKERVLFCHCDVTDYSQYEEAFQTTMTEFDNIDIVINNAEIWNDKFWELEVDVNLNGTIRGTLLAQRFMGRNNGGSGGIVINIGSVTSVRPQISTPIYSATKHAILALSRSCGDAYHFNLTGVRVVAVCPALLENAMTSHSKRFKSPNHEKAWQLDVKGLMPQKLEHVAKCVIPIIKDATSGSIWLIANGKSAKEIPYSAVQL